MAHSASRRRYRSVFLSDLHLGARTCRATAILDFLDGIEAEQLYLLGDVVDGWRLQQRWYWPKAHAAVLNRLIHLARSGVEVTYIPGNHDAFARAWCGTVAADVRIEQEALHTAADGRRYLLAHGDAYDPGADSHPLKRIAGDVLYRALMRLDRTWRWGRRQGGRAETSFAAWAKGRSPLARRVVAEFEAHLAMEARRRGLDGVVCGHIHSPGVREMEGVTYVNCGDWVESCSAVVEAADGVLEVVHWRPEPQPAVRRPLSVPSLAPA
jgi:UDP-2,3-diacylglucosamine pyrophosphatase LpxH